MEGFKALGFAVFAIILILILGYADADVSASTSKMWSRVDAGEMATFTIDQDGIPFTIMTFSLETMTENVDIELNVLTSNDTRIESPAPDETYKYIQVVPTNIQTSNLESAAIGFRVDNDWISSNSINKDTIALYQYGTSWSELYTVLLSEDDNYLHYSTYVDKFSLFAISGEKGPVELLCTPEETKCTDNDLYQCSLDGMSWTLTDACGYGCESGACRQSLSCPECPENPECPEAPECPECTSDVCSSGEQKCSGNDLLQCNPEGTGWETVKSCFSGCAVCLSEPEECNELPYMIAILILAVVIVIVLGIYLRVHK